MEASINNNTTLDRETYSEPIKTCKMDLSAKAVDCIQLLTIFAKHFILGVSQGYEYAYDKVEQNPGAFSLIPQKIRTAMSANFFHFKFNFIITLPCGETLLITNSIHASNITMKVEYILY